MGNLFIEMEQHMKENFKITKSMVEVSLIWQGLRQRKILWRQETWKRWICMIRWFSLWGFSNNMFQGKETYVWSDSKKYKGEWKEGCMVSELRHRIF